MTSNVQVVNTDDPAFEWPQITPSDSAVLDPLPRGILAATAGNVVLEDRKGNTITLAVTAGQLLRMRPRKVRATGTTATVHRLD